MKTGTGLFCGNGVSEFVYCKNHELSEWLDLKPGGRESFLLGFFV